MNSITSIGDDTLSSILVFEGHPRAHPEPWLWNVINDKYAQWQGGYDNWLIRAPVPSSQAQWPIAVSKITRLFKDGWWDSNLRFGYRAFRMLPYTTTDELGGVLPTAWDVPPIMMTEMSDAASMGDLLGRSMQSSALAGYLGAGYDCIEEFDHR